MITNNDTGLRTYLSKLNRVTGTAMKNSMTAASSRTHYDIQLEHVLSTLLETPNTDLDCIITHFKVSKRNIEDEVTQALRRLKSGNQSPLTISARVTDLLGTAWECASILFQKEKIRSSHFLYALLEEPTLYGLLRGISPTLAQINPRELTSSALNAICRENIETTEEEALKNQAKTSSPALSTKHGADFLERYTINLNQKAIDGKIDPVLGRAEETTKMIDILLRKRKNNPILTGEAGVGKTAVVEGFVLRLVKGEVPDVLKDTVVRTLDLGLLQAGAGLKGEFENRLKGVIEDVQQSPIPIILFIDEILTLVGTGADSGQGDAANLMKPALARGELRTIGATTFKEHKKYFASDAALARRFQEIKILEPSTEEAIQMVRGVAKTFQEHHQVVITDAAIQAAVQLSQRYIQGQQLPDKAIAVLDTAASRVALAQTTRPLALVLKDQHLESLELEQEILEAETKLGATHGSRLHEINQKIVDLSQERKTLQTQWEQEQQLLAEFLKQRDSFPNPESIQRLKTQLKKIQGQNPLVFFEVDDTSVSEVISNWTGIPIGRMVQTHLQKALLLEDSLEEKVIGQNHAIKIIANRVRTSLANLIDPRRPRGVFLFVGPSGIGKTETATQLADLMFGGERSLITINMSEYKESYRISSLKGSAPGHVGYREGGVLTQAVKRRPYSVVLLDEIEKAHEDVQELFYQVFDKGTLEDGDGEVVDFKNTIIILTSNIGSDLMMAACSDPDPDLLPSPEVLEETIRPELLKVFKPALLGRMTVVPYYPLTNESLRKIIQIQLRAIENRLWQNYKTKLRCTEGVLNLIASRCKDPESGARIIDRIIQNTILPEISTEIINRTLSGQLVKTVEIDVLNEGFKYQFLG